MATDSGRQNIALACDSEEFDYVPESTVHNCGCDAEFHP